MTCTLSSEVETPGLGMCPRGISSECCATDDGTGDWRLFRLRCRCFIQEKEKGKEGCVCGLMPRDKYRECWLVNAMRTRKVDFLLQVATMTV